MSDTSNIHGASDTKNMFKLFISDDSRGNYSRNAIHCNGKFAN